MWDPLRHVYLHGPSWCCWAGRPPHDICAALTGVDSSHWVGAPSACTELLRRHYAAFAVGAGSVAVGAAAWYALSLWYNQRLVRAAAREFAAVSKWSGQGSVFVPRGAARRLMLTGGRRSGRRGCRA